MEVTARLKSYRVSAQKARLVADEVRGKGVADALAILDFSNKRFARPLAKLVRSAVANAEESNNRDRAGIDIDNLVVSAITVDQGATSWRIRARAQGRAAWIAHRSSHIRVVLSEE
ncbi:MAG: 50S ribosomal protein L22 [Dehalococcoidia bacterium]